MKKSSLFGAGALLCAGVGTVAFLASCVGVQAAPATVTTAQGRGADTSVRGGSYASRNFGTLDILRVSNTANLIDARKTYLRFDLATLPTPVKSATGAALNLTLAPSEGSSPADKTWTFAVSGLKDGSSGENWSEASTNWDNAPASKTASGSELSEEALPLGTFTITGKGTSGQPIVFSSPALLKFLQGDTNGIATLVITRNEQNEGNADKAVHIFASKESTRLAGPVLSVGYNGQSALLPSPPQPTLAPVTDVTAIKPLPFEADIARYEASDKQNPPAKGGIVFVGSSSIRLWKTLAQDFPGYNVINRGFGGSQISDSVNFVHRIVTPYEPQMIVFYAGTNDINAGKSVEKVVGDYKTFVAQVRSKLPKTTIAFIALSPAPSRVSKFEQFKQVNTQVKEFSTTDPNLKFIDVYPLMLDDKGEPRPELFVSDRLHMNPDGYAIWVKAVGPYLPKKAAH